MCFFLAHLISSQISWLLVQFYYDTHFSQSSDCHLCLCGSTLYPPPEPTFLAVTMPLRSQLPMSTAECGLRPWGRPQSALQIVIFFRTYGPWGNTLPSTYILSWIKSVNKWKTSPDFSLVWYFPPVFILHWISPQPLASSLLPISLFYLFSYIPLLSLPLFLPPNIST